MTKEDNEEESLTLPLLPVLLLTHCFLPFLPWASWVSSHHLSSSNPLYPLLKSVLMWTKTIFSLSKSHTYHSHLFFFLHQTTSDKVRQHRQTTDKKVSNVMINWIHILLYRCCERLKSALIRPLKNNKMFWQQKSFCMLPPHGVWHMDWNIQKKQKKDAGGWKKHTRRPKVLFRTEHTPCHIMGITQVSHISKLNKSKLECFYCHINACDTLLNYDLYLSTSA